MVASQTPRTPPATEPPMGPKNAPGGWGARVVAAAVLTALVEVAFVLPYLPAAASDGFGLFLYALFLSALLILAGLPVAAAGWFVERRFPRRLRLPRPSTLLTAVAGTVLAAVPLRFFDGYIASKRSEFPEYTERLQSFLLPVVLLLSVVVAFLVLRPAATWLLARAPSLGRSRPIAAFLCVVWALGAMAAAHLALAPVHQDQLAGLAGLGALVAMLSFARIAAPDVGAKWRRWGAPLALVVVLSGLLGAARDSHASFVLHGHSRTGALVGRWVRVATDFDGDGAAPTWLGGADCAAFDGSRGPAMREVPADGIDQDCRGGDAALPPEQIPRSSLWPGCRPQKTRLSVVLVLIDALRADALDQRVMPRLSAFSETMMRFTRAYSPSTETFFSVPGILVGQSLPAGAANLMAAETFDVGAPLAELLGEAGWRTGAYSYLPWPPALVSGFQKMNEQYVDRNPRGAKEDLSSADTTRGGLEFVAASDGPFFLWLHYTDVHAPYLDPDDEMFAKPDDTPYERVARYVDFHVAKFLSELRNSPFGRTTAVVITADHGEDLGRRGREGHGPDVFEDTIHVPLLLHVPGCPPAVIDQPVSGRSIAPTMALLTGVEAQGRSLLPLVDEEPPLPVVVESLMRDGRYRRAIVLARYKLIHDVTNGGRMLFDLQVDPGETKNVYRREPARAAEIERLYQRWLDRP